MTEETFDYVVVGAGSAGCVLADRLTEDGRTRVLVLEAGGSDLDPYIRIPLAWGRLFGSRRHDWGYDTEPEPNLNGRVLDCARGKVIGGSSSTNAMAYARGHASDYDGWGLDGWRYADVLPYFKRAESWEDGETAYRGGSGPLTTIRDRLDDPLVDAWFAAGARMGLPRTDDTNAAEQVGFDIPQWTIRNGRRCSAADAYLKPALRRRNLSVRRNAMAKQILFEGRRATGVAFEVAGQRTTVRARREVILACGTINSPHLLAASGIGEAGALAAAGITPLVNRPGVGRNLQDHMSVPMEYARKTRGTFQRQLRWDRFARMVMQGLVFRSGGTTGLPMGCVAFLRSRIAGPSADFAMLFRASVPKPQQYLPGTDPGDDGAGYRIALLKPKSRGWLSFTSPDTSVAPRITQNFLSDDRDMTVAVEGLQLIRALNADEEVARHVGAELLPGPAAATTEDLMAHVRAHATTVHHPVGTCRMGRPDDEMAVVDAQLRVIGCDSLRVVDASIMPEIVSGATNGPSIMIGEKGADLIRGGAA